MSWSIRLEGGTQYRQSMSLLAGQTTQIVADCSNRMKSSFAKWAASGSGVYLIAIGRAKNPVVLTWKSYKGMLKTIKVASGNWVVSHSSLLRVFLN